jgi:hypothetical protein
MDPLIETFIDHGGPWAGTTILLAGGIITYLVRRLGAERTRNDERELMTLAVLDRLVDVARERGFVSRSMASPLDQYKPDDPTTSSKP